MCLRGRVRRFDPAVDSGLRSCGRLAWSLTVRNRTSSGLNQPRARPERRAGWCPTWPAPGARGP